LDRKVRAYMQDMRRLGNTITNRVVMAAALGIVKKRIKPYLLKMVDTFWSAKAGLDTCCSV